MDEVTERVLAIFREISKIPRCSRNEENIALWLKEWGINHGFSVKFDNVNNVVIGIPASEGYEETPVVVIQGHMDMVCEKARNSRHDFKNDPVVPFIDGDWLRAQGTTLGADNGIGLALALALAGDREIAHPPLELLFTVDEETGLTGANALMQDHISGRILLNIDSENEGVLIVGCAGGVNTTIRMPLDYSALPEDAQVFRLVVSGLSGGHSGVDIHKGRGNANKILASALQLLDEKIDVRLIDIKGGSAHNAIPRDAEAILARSSGREQSFSDLISEFENDIISKYSGTDPGLSVKLSVPDNYELDEAMSSVTTDKVIELLGSLPHGVVSMSPEIAGLVETSGNLATMEVINGELMIVSSQRSSQEADLADMTSQIGIIARTFGAGYSNDSAYPAWQPDMSSPLLLRCREVYSEIFGTKPKTEVIHAGLECAVIGSIYEGMDMISIGPTIIDPHSPDESLHIPSVRKVWDFMVALLASFREPWMGT